MKRSNPRGLVGPSAWLCAGLALVFAAGLSAKDPPPQVSDDGLELKQATKTRLIYVRPGASLEQYKRVAILDCFVEFEKDWQREYNDQVIGTQGRVTDADVERIKKALADEFKTVFTEELQKGGYQVVNTAAPDVLVLRPALLNVKANAPDLMKSGMSSTIVDSAGQMTLLLELWDSTTNKLLARAMDVKADYQSFPQPGNRVTNKAAADKILRGWAQQVVKHLDAVRGKPES